MPNIKKAAKRMRQAEKARQRNMEVKTRIKHIRAKVLKGGENLEQAESLYRSYCSVLDKAAKKGVISHNTADRRKQRAAARLLKAKNPAPAQSAVESSASSNSASQG